VNEIDLRQIERNIFRDYFEDGLADMMIGAYFVLIGLGLAVGTVAPFIVLIVFFAPWLRALKRRVTYPRTGYVELRDGDPQALPWFIVGSAALGLLALVVTLIAAGVIARPGQWYRWMPIGFGIWMAGVFLGLGVRVGMVRYYVAAAVALASGPTFALLPLTGKLEPLGLHFATLGAVLLAWGTAALLRFVRQYPLPGEENGDAPV
jgi:hypothetical protein